MNRYCRLPLFMLASIAIVEAAAADEKPLVKVEIRKAESKAADGLIEAKVEGKNQKVYLHKELIITNVDIASAKAVPAPGADPENYVVELTFSKEGSEKMAKATADHIDKPMAILIDGKVVAAPILKAKISDACDIWLGRQTTKEEAEKLAKAIVPK